MAVRHEKTLARLIVLLMLLLFFSSASYGLSLADAPPRPGPGFSLAALNGETVSLSMFEGRDTLLLFGTTWCPHCESVLMVLEDIYNSAGEQVNILFIAVGQDAEQLMDFFGDEIPPYRVLPDPNHLVSSLYGIKRVPTCAFIDESGQPQYIGRFNEEIVWRLLSGERLVYPETPYRNLQASDRLTQTDSAALKKTKRFIVELDEEPEFWKKLSKTALKSRRAQFHKAARRIGGRMIHNYGTWKNNIVLEIPPDKVDKLKELPRFRNYKEDRRVHALLEDSVYQIKADYAWDNAITGQGVKVCVVDTGIDYTHPDLQNKVVAQYDFTTNTQDAMDDHGHGTHCAGIIASQGLQYRGVSYDVALLGAKVLDHAGSGYSSDVIRGIEWCVEQQADVISLSLGEGLYSGTCDYDEMAQAVNAAVDAGVVVACAAGNDGDSTRMVSPACASKVIAVGAVDKLDNIASYSDGGDELDLVAPGGEQFGGTNFAEIVSTFSTEVANNPFYCFYLIGEDCYDNYFVVDGTRYIRAIGTSMATPHVAAAAALLLEENSSLTPTQIKQVLEDNADDLGDSGWDNIYGWGRINIQKALENIPPEAGELIVKIAEPNAADSFLVNEQFALTAEVDCFGGDGCGDVLVHAQFCSGYDCNDFVDINSSTAMSTLDNNPNELGILSGYTIETDVPVVFDVQTMLDISQNAYTKSVNPGSSLVGSTLPGEYNTGDLEPNDGVGTEGQDIQVHYDFNLPAGIVKTLKVRMENYMVIHWDYPPFAGWYVYTSDADGDNLHLVGDCIPAMGGGGETPPPDCWFISDDPNVLNDLNAGGVSYIKLVSHDVGDNDWLFFNDIEVIVEYEIDPNNDEVYEYYVKFDINDIDLSNELTAARLKINVTQAAENSVADVYLVDNTLLATDSAQMLHEANDPCYTSLVNPIKSFSCENTGTISLNVKSAVEEALLSNQDLVAFQITERDNDQLFAIDANNSENPPILTISQKCPQGACEQSPGGSAGDPNNGPRTLTYDTAVVKDINEDSYLKYDNPASAVIGAQFESEYNTGDLEPNNAVGTEGEDRQEHYEFMIPSGVVKTLKVRMENYLVVHWDYPPFAGWYVYTSNADGDNLRLVGDCIPAEGGGGEAQPPDCWFVSEDPVVLSDLTPGGTSYIKLVSHDVGEGDWLFFNDIEVIVEYEIDPNNDSVNRYYLKYDISDLPSDAKVDSAMLNLYVSDANADAVGRIDLVNSTYDPCTDAYTIYDAEDAGYSGLTNPIKTFACDTAGLKQLNVKRALEDAVQSDVDEIAFLISEQNENAIFTIDANGGSNPPSLNVYLKSENSSGFAGWNVLPNMNGPFMLRVKAENNIGLTGVSDAMVVDVFDPNLPVINSVDCMINSTWQDCRLVQYDDTLQKIRIDANDPQEIPQVRLILRNVPDDHNFVDEQLTYSDGYFIHNTDLEISDSGRWQINVLCTDSDGNADAKTITWNIPWGTLTSQLINPTADINVPKSSSFSVQTSIQCHDAECPDANMGLILNKARELIYDDYTPESYGDADSIDAHIAVQFTPASYPAQLTTARFYVWDTTTYPFKLHVWDDDGDGGAPGTELIPPLTVDPVVPSIADPNMDPNVAWFNVDLSVHNIIIDSGDFYIGVTQIEEGKLNQVGFDMEGDSYYPFTRSWAYLPSDGWFNLDYYCHYCEFYPDLCDFICSILPDSDLCTGGYCGNIMIRAMVSEPGTYSGDLSRTVGPAAFYTLDDHPYACPDMDPGDTCNAEFQVNAIGAAAEKAKFYASAEATYSHALAGPVEVTITSPETDCDAANLDAIGLVDFGDFAVLAAQWLETTPPLSADIHIDQSIDMLDIAAMASHWLEACEE